MVSLLTSNGLGKNVIGIAQRVVAADALAGEILVLTVWLQIGSAPSCPSPAKSVGIFLAVPYHELHLKERSRVDKPFVV